MAKTKATLKFPRTKRFSIADCIARNTSLNEQTVRTLVRGAIADGVVEVVGKQPGVSRGRPAFILALV